MSVTITIPDQVQALAGIVPLEWPRDRDRILELIMSDPRMIGGNWLLDVLQPDDIATWIRSRRGRLLKGSQLAFWSGYAQIPESEWRPWDTHMAERPQLSRLPAIQLPPFFADLFWNEDFTGIRWPDDFPTIFNRVVQYGDEDQVRWLLETAGQSFPRDWFVWSEGKPLGGPALFRWGMRLGVDREPLEHWDACRTFKIA